MADYLTFFSNILIPLVFFVIVGYAALQKKQVYDDFVKGAKDGLQTVVKIVPTLIGLMLGIATLRASGFLDFLSEKIAFFTKFLHFPSELVPLVIVRMFSSSAATGLTLDLFKKYGTDSVIGLTASIAMSCTETIFYTMSVYFMVAKVTKTRWTLAGTLLATLSGIAASTILAGIMYNSSF